MSRKGLFEFDPADGMTYRQGLPPIVGRDGGSTWFGGGHVSVAQEVLPPSMVDGFSILVDLQPDRTGEQTVLGIERTGGSALRLIADSKEVQGALRLDIRDEAGRRLSIEAEGSVARARRVAITSIPRMNQITFYELQPWAPSPGEPLATTTLVAEAPQNVHLDAFVAAGHSRDGVTVGTFDGRVAELALFPKVLRQESLGRLAAASDNPTDLLALDLGKPTPEHADTLLRQARRLRRLATSATFGPDERDDAALLLYSWLFSKHPMLPLICRLLGIQLWMPGRGDPSERHPSPAELEGDWLQLLAAPDVDSSQFAWMTLSEWSGHTAFRVGNPAHSVSREAFVKFVRNKLGWGHFDERDRTAWQARLLLQAGVMDLAGMDALVFQMHALVREIALALSVSRIEPALRQLLD